MSGFKAPPACRDAELVERVVVAVEDVTNVPAEVFMSGNRQAHLLRARRLVYLALRSFGFSLPAIAVVASKDHTTVLSQMRRVSDEEVALAETVVASVQGRPSHLVFVLVEDGYAVKHPGSGELKMLPSPLNEGLVRWLEIL